jgi:hypothetical protein
MKLNKRSVALLVSWALLLTVAVGVTVAFIADKTPEMENTFQPSYVDCEVNKTGDTIYKVTNTGDTNAYVRVAVVVNWKNTTTSNIYAQAPQFAVNVSDGWLLGSDGYYYYTGMLAPKAVTSAFTVTSSGTAPDGYALSVEIVASAIQATPNAVEAWSNAVVAPSEGAALVAKS